MKIQMLGPFSVELDGKAVKLAGPKQRAVLSLLATRANTTVSIEQLIDGLWGEEPPASAPKMVQQYVSQLRRLFPDGDGPEILTRGRGYELRVDPAEVDVLCFEQLVERAARDGNGERGDVARDALALWCGQPFCDLMDEPFAAPEARRLEELYLRATELAIEGDLGAGRDAEVVAPLRALIEEHPLRERLRGLLMLALYRSGRQAEALDAFQEARWTLVEELGLEPGPELRRLQEAILRQDPALERVVPDAAWASHQTVRQVGAGAGRISQARGALRADERELAANVIDLQTLRKRGAPASGSPACPFKGLESFDVSDTELYFGRERLVAEIVARLPGTSLLGVIGPSGSGKSSAVRAGLVPALGGGVLPGSDRWVRAVMRPGEQPTTALRRALRAPDEAADPVAAALDAVPADARLLLVVDQFEETFAACRDDAERTAFLDVVIAPAARGDARYLAVLALRADYYGACAAHPQLARLLGENHVLVGPMRTDELERAIEGPAATAGLEVEPELVSRLVEETAGRPGGLPLLSTTLLELWQGRTGNRMTIAAYERTGGVQGAVARLAETAYQSLTPDEATTARNLLLRLAGESEPGAAVRRQVPLSELDLARSEAARHVLDVLTENRLLTVGGDTVEVAHEALLREWPRLRKWLEEDSEARRLHRHITLAARDWDAGGRDPAELYRGARLASALDFAADHDDALNTAEREFLDEAGLVSERDTLRARHMNRLLRGLLAAALVALVIAAAAGVLALDQRGEARDQAQIADAQRLGAQALIEDQPDRALLLARAGVALDDSVATRGSLLATLFREPPALLGVIPLISDADIYGLALSPAGDRLALGDFSGNVRVFELPSRRQVGIYQIGDVERLAFSADGRTLAVGGHDPSEEPAGGLIDLIDARTLRRQRRIVLPPPAKAGAFIANTPVFTPDGRGLIVLRTPFGPRQPHLMQRFDPRTGAPIGKPLQLSSDTAFGMMVTENRAFVTSGPEDATWEIDTDSLRILRRYPAGGTAGALAPGGRTIALGSSDGEVRLLDLRSGRIRTFAGRAPDEVTRMRFTPDGRTLVVASVDGSVLVWDVGLGTVRERFEGHTEAADGLAVTPDGRELITGGYDGRAFVWDLTGEQRIVRPIPLGKPFLNPEEQTPRGSAISPDGRTLAVTGDGTVDLIDAQSLTRRAQLRPSEEPALAAGFSPDGRLLALSDAKGQVTLWDAATRAPLGRLEGLDGWTQALAFSPDSKLLAASQVDGEPRLLVWDVERRALTKLKAETAASSLAFSRDGRLLAASDFVTGTTRVYDVRTGALVRTLESDSVPRSVAFSPDGRLLFVGDYSGVGRFYTTRDWRQSGAPIRGQGQRLTSAQFTPDGRILAIASADGSALVLDVASRKPIGSPMVVESEAYLSSVLSPDGRFLYALPTGREGMRIDLSPAAWGRQACRIAGRELTEREWSEAVPRQPYRTLCS